ncbi:MAG: trehalose-6-phosphate synthase, partial [Microbacteriaceae bacterium]
MTKSSTHPPQPNDEVPMSGAKILVLSNRLPVDYVAGENDDIEWEISPGGLVSALSPVMAENHGTWIGWPGQPDLTLEPFSSRGISLVPVPLSQAEYEDYYEGFSNDTIWPLYHDVIHPPSYHREWWHSYQQVNRRFAQKAADLADADTLVWVQDYQLQLVPQYLRELRPELNIGYFHHIPFPSYGLYSQLPWRKQILRGLLGADLIGFQRPADAGNFLISAERLLGVEVSQLDSAIGMDFVESATIIDVQSGRKNVVRSMPISIASERFNTLAAEPRVKARVAEIRSNLGNPKKVILGVDRLDYTKGIRHRIKAYGELLAEGKVIVGDVAMVQVATPSRENLESYRDLRDEIELTIGRMNGEFGTLEHAPLTYLHHSYPLEEMVALYLAADVL